MFSGIVETLGEVLSRDAGAHRDRAADTVHRPHFGESIAVDGACLTVAALGDGDFTADVMPETFHRTILGALAAGATVNLERALQMGDRVGGHMITGHVDATGIATAAPRRRQRAMGDHRGA